MSIVKSIHHIKIGSPFTIYYAFYFKDYHLQSPFSRSYCWQVFSRATALKAEGQTFIGILQKICSEKHFKIQIKPPFPSLFNKVTCLELVKLIKKGSGRGNFLWNFRRKKRETVQQSTFGFANSFFKEHLCMVASALGFG